MFIPILIITALAICAIGIPLIALILLPGIYAETQRSRQSEARIELDRLRKQRLERDLTVVENRAHLVASQEALVALRIEEKRRELGMGAERTTPTTPGSDSPAW